MDPTREDKLPVAKKKRRLRGACDSCRQKKVRCDSAIMPGTFCSNCVEFEIDCTHDGKRQPKGASESLASAEPSMSQLGAFPGLSKKYRDARSTVAAILSASTPYSVPKDSAVLRRTLVDLAQYIEHLEKELEALGSTDEAASPPEGDPPLPNDQDTHTILADAALSSDMSKLRVAQSVYRFNGPSSDTMILKSVIEVRKEYIGKQHSLPEPAKRRQYWRIHPWQQMPDMVYPLEFPEPDLLHDLIELYFANMNLIVPLFHRPTFDRLLADNKHLSENQFGMTVLGMCAIAARYSQDPRVREDDVSDLEEGDLKLGWKWFRQVVPIRASFQQVTIIYELQLICVSIIYLFGTSAGETCWLLLGIAVRLVQDVGLHRRFPASRPRTIETELWKRAFWVIISMDIFVSAFQGRPRAAQSDDYDQELPVDCDDEYWEHPDPEKAFQQPPDKPSTMSFFISYLKLIHILAFAEKTIHGVTKSQPWLTNSTKLDARMIMRIDSALNEWVSAVPDHLRWDPHRENQTFFNQSSLMYCVYYYVQILVHKAFIPRSGVASANTSLPSLAICANAARSCCRIVDVQSRRGYLSLPHVIVPLYTSALVLLLNRWTGRRMALVSNPDNEYADVYKCLNLLHLSESRWQPAGRVADILEQLLNIEDSREPTTSLKRSRPEADSEPIFQPTLLYPDDDLSLPFHTNELGQFPVHGLFGATETWPQGGQTMAPEPQDIHALINEADLMRYIESMEQDPYALDPGFLPIFDDYGNVDYGWGNTSGF
ncbi:fungal-specific transcription factor domain-containing protein [Mycena floridula]|nr:fungal-specific transcription factor domain-containing protein [Mycena floridula]